MGQYDTLYKEITTSNAPEKLIKIQKNLLSIQENSYTLSQREDYCVKSHEEDFDYTDYMSAKTRKPFRKEEWMCKLCVGKCFPLIGEIVDYQVPLKHTRGAVCAGMGKVDMLSVDGDTAWLLELKVPESTEPPLRAIMEVYTYWRQLGGEQCERFLTKSKARGTKTLKKAIVIFERSEEGSLYQKLRADWEPLSALMEALGVSCFVAQLKDSDPGCDEIVGVSQCKL